MIISVNPRGALVVRRRILTVTCLTLALLALPTTPAVASQWQYSVSVSVLHLMNQERAAHGLPPLHMNTTLRKTAYNHDLLMQRYDRLTHRTPGEPPFFYSRILRDGYRFRCAGENIGVINRISLAAALRLQRMMYAERPPNDAHRRNILSRCYRDVGVAVLVDHKHGKLWLTEDFAAH
jgi:uncharacterized protein YkwD